MPLSLASPALAPCVRECKATSRHGVLYPADGTMGAAVALELQRADGPVSIWRDAHPASPATPAAHSTPAASPTSPSSPTAKYANRVYLHVGAEGLFPRPMHAEDAELGEVCQRMRLLGRLIAKALRDGFNVPLPLSPAFFGAGARSGRGGRPRTCRVEAAPAPCALRAACLFVFVCGVRELAGWCGACYLDDGLRPGVLAWLMTFLALSFPPAPPLFGLPLPPPMQHYSTRS